MSDTLRHLLHQQHDVDAKQPLAMFSDISNSTLTVLGCISALAITAAVFSPAKLLRWAQKKRYQYEVTFSLYMMTPTEKFIFNSILFLFLSMVVIAASLYLPEHISFITRRAFYYFDGDADQASVAATAARESAQSVYQTAIKSAASALSSAAPDAVKDAVETVKSVVSDL